MAEVRSIARTYRYLIAAKIRSDFQYRVSFFFFLASQTVATGLDLVVILVLFQVIPSLGDWNVSQVAVLYGLTTMSFGLGDLFISQVETAAMHIRQGTFDRFLLRPLPIAVQLSASEFALRRVGRSIPAVAALSVALFTADIHWSLDRILLIPLTVASGVVIFGSVWVVTSSISFWLIEAQEVANSFTYGGSYAHQYPMHIYSQWVRTLLGWIIPMGFVAYVPATYLLNAPNPLGLPPWLAFTPPLVAALCALVARAIWDLAIRNYQSTGS